MSDQIHIEALTPQPLPDLQRVSLILRMSGLPAYGHATDSNLLQFFDMPLPTRGAQAEKPSQSLPTSNSDLFPTVKSPREVPTGDHPSPGKDRPASPYPDVTLSILDQHGNEIAATFIVEHKEPELEFTLHLRTYEPGATYIARAEMTMNDEIIQMVQVPFELTERI